MTRSTRRWRDRDARAREAALTRRCPKCRAVPGAPCWATWGQGTVSYFHEERMR